MRRKTALGCFFCLAVAVPAAAQCPGSGDCCTGNGTPGCDDETCCQKVCLTDPFCCDIVWDSLCAVIAGETCTVCGAGCPGTGSCCAANSTPGCDDETCCEDVCAADPFCCSSLWDALCAGLAEELCPPCEPEPVDGDVNGDGVVGIADFTILLGSWGPCDDCADCPADLDDDCDVGIADFLFLLGHWS